MLLFGWSPLVLLFPSLPILVPILRWLYRVNQIQLVSPSFSRSTISFTSFNPFVRSSYLSLFSLPFSFILWSARTTKFTIRQFLFSLFFFFFVFLTITRSRGLAEIKWSVCILKSQRSLCVSFSWTDSCLCTYHLFVWSNLNFLHNSKWNTFPTQSCLVLYSCTYF